MPLWCLHCCSEVSLIYRYEWFFVSSELTKHSSWLSSNTCLILILYWGFWSLWPREVLYFKRKISINICKRMNDPYPKKKKKMLLKCTNFFHFCIFFLIVFVLEIISFRNFFLQLLCIEGKTTECILECFVVNLI